MTETPVILMAAGTSLFTDNEGKVEGEFFIPNTDTERFRTGVREFKLLDINRLIMKKTQRLWQLQRT